MKRDFLLVSLVLSGAMVVATQGCGSPASPTGSDAADAAPVDSGAPDVGPADVGSPSDLAPDEVSPWQPVEPFGANIGPVTTCDTSKPFGPPAVIQGFTMDDHALSLSKDLLTMYLTSSGGHVSQFSFGIFTVTRPSVTAPFDRVAGFPPSFRDSHDAMPGADGHRIYWVNDSHVNFWDPTKPEGAPGARGSIDGIATNRFWFSSDEKLLYYSKSTDTNAVDLHVADVANDVSSNPRTLANVNSTSDDMDPVLTADGLTLYFSSNRPGAPVPEPGYFDVYVARRAKASDPFGAAQLVSELNTPRQDYVLWVSPEGCTIYLRRLAEGANRSFHVATRGK